MGMLIMDAGAPMARSSPRRHVSLTRLVAAGGWVLLIGSPPSWA